MTPKEMAERFQLTFGLDFHDFYDVGSWKNERIIRLDMFKLDEWFDKTYGSEQLPSLRDKIINHFGEEAAEFAFSIL